VKSGNTCPNNKLTTKNNTDPRLVSFFFDILCMLESIQLDSIWYFVDVMLPASIQHIICSKTTCILVPRVLQWPLKHAWKTDRQSCWYAEMFLRIFKETTYTYVHMKLNPAFVPTLYAQLSLWLKSHYFSANAFRQPFMVWLSPASLVILLYEWP